MKLVVLIPCLNEEKDIAAVINSIPKSIPGIDKIIKVLLDDHSEDQSCKIATDNNIDFIVKNKRRLGLAKNFKLGLLYALSQQADIIVTIDGDGQYQGEEIPALIQPVLNGNADIVIGDRQIDKLDYISTTVKLLQKTGSCLVSKLANERIPDVVSGFRCFNLSAAQRLNILTDFSYTIESILQCSHAGLKITSIPITARATERPSRLMKNRFDFILKSGITILRVFLMYNPLKTFTIAALPLLLIGSILGFRFFYWFFLYNYNGHTQSLIIACICIILGFLLIIAGILADLIQFNRRLLNDIKVSLANKDTKNER